jgi:hypothetical protein
MKAQVTNFLTKTAEFHVGMAQAHQAAMEACEEGEPQHEFHKAALAAHAGMGEHAVEACKVLQSASKAMLSDDRDEVEIIPGISAVAPDAPGRGRAVLRTGQRQIPTASDEDSTFAKIFQIGDDE